MAFLSRLGSILKQSVSKQTGIGSQISASNPSIYQALRCMSSSKVFVGGLPYSINDSSLRDTFAQYGDVIEAKVIIDREQNRSRGFGFVTFASTEEASSAIQALDGQDLQGRRVKVDYAAERAPRPFSGGGGYGGGGYNSGGLNQGVGAGLGDSIFGGGAAAGDAPADAGFPSSGFESGSGFGNSAGDQFGIGSVGSVGNNDAGNFDLGDLSGPPEGNFGDDEPSDFVKRA
ncbi:hypothetical protein vseg_017204 [Gypsophila vaccaria]